MKVNNTPTSSLNSVSGSESKSRPSRTSSSSESSSTSSTSGVKLSSLSSQLLKMEEGINNTPVVDENKVAQIKQAITEGRYQINPGKIADGLIDSVRQILKDQ